MGFLKKKRSAKALAAAARRAHGSRDFAEEKRTAGRGQLQDLHGTSGARWAACVCVCVCVTGSWVCECTCKCAYASSSAHVAHPYTRDFALVACARCAGPVGDHIDPDKRSVEPDASSCAGVHSACCVPLPLLPLLRVLLPLACGRGWVDG